jgi:hypothetical protein
MRDTLDKRNGPSANALILTIPGNPVSNLENILNMVDFPWEKPSMMVSEGRKERRGINGPQQMSEITSVKAAAHCEQDLWI